MLRLGDLPNVLFENCRNQAELFLMFSIVLESVGSGSVILA